MRVCLFTDTLADVNGVSRFIQNMAEQAAAAGNSLTVVTSTRMELPRTPGVVNLAPAWARPMPRYPNLDLAAPSPADVSGLLRRLRPDAVHVSTPGPVGFLGRRAARRMGVPVLGTYHTDFPAYIEHLFEDACLTWAARAAMGWFYRPMAAVFTRSREYAAAIEGLGVGASRIVPLLAGIDTELFDRGKRDEGVWEGVGVARDAVKALFVGRVSVEKNLPLLARTWPHARRNAAALGTDLRLVVIGDGPYRAEMEGALGRDGAHFLGFRHGEELAALYASADFFVFPSATDTLGQVVMEAQASGLAALVSDRGGPRGVIEDGASGRVLPAFEAGAWSRAIAAMAVDGEARRRMGERGYELMRTRGVRATFEHFWGEHERRAAIAGGRFEQRAPVFKSQNGDAHAEAQREKGALTAH